jgi:hypothetical protein
MAAQIILERALSKCTSSGRSIETTTQTGTTTTIRIFSMASTKTARRTTRFLPAPKPAHRKVVMRPNDRSIATANTSSGTDAGLDCIYSVVKISPVNWIGYSYIFK